MIKDKYYYRSAKFMFQELRTYKGTAEKLVIAVNTCNVESFNGKDREYTHRMNGRDCQHFCCYKTYCNFRENGLLSGGIIS